MNGAVQVAAGDLRLPGELARPPQAMGLVLFAHGSGSSRFSSRRDCAPHRLTVIAGAGHLFEQPGTLEQVGAAAVDWFSRQLPQRA